MEKETELSKEKVNIYETEYGKAQEFCLQDCIDDSVWLSIEH